MKKLSRLFSLIALFLLIPTFCWAVAGSCVQTTLNYPNSNVKKVVFTCTGSSIDGSIPNTAIDAPKTLFISGYYLFQVDAYPTAGGTAPDAADVFILNANGLDLLGAEDGSTTAYEGLNLIHATLARSAVPDIYIPRAGIHAFYYPFVTGALTLKVANQATVSANYTVVLSFTK